MFYRTSPSRHRHRSRYKRSNTVALETTVAATTTRKRITSILTLKQTKLTSTERTFVTTDTRKRITSVSTLEQIITVTAALEKTVMTTAT
jgi:hypothetical protein